MVKFDAPHAVITDVMAGHAKWRPRKTALVCGDRRVSWEEFNRGINRVANALLAAGLKKNGKVSVLSSNRVEMAEVIFGTLKAGGVIVPLSAMMSAEGLAAMIQDSDSEFLFCDALLALLISPFKERMTKVRPDGFIALGFEAPGWRSYESFTGDAPETEPAVELGFEDDCNVIYSSGTTGTPKGIVHTHYARSQFALALGLDFRMDSSSVPIVTTPMYHNGTWMIMLPAMIAGATLVIMEKFGPREFLELVQKERCTHTFMVPTQFIMILALPDLDQYDVSSMKIMISAAAPLRREVKERILQKLTRGLMELYGLTEGVGSSLKPEEMEGKLGSVGTPIFGIDLRIIDDQGKELPRGQVGEIIGYSPGLLKEYYKRPRETEAAIWRDERGRTFLRTGDVGRFDEDGFLYILDRKKDMIISGGINVFATDIEEVIGRHPAVLDVAVIGVPHEKWGESPLALVIPKTGAEAKPEEIKEWANAKLAKFQRVCAVELRDQLPRNAIGKVLKRVLREQYWKE
ncbi:MAG TPA: AMP-binding protein [bacterium]|nr:AMP-binding protein [bacterium]